MARWMEPTLEDEEEYRQWVAERPEVVRKIAERFTPWTLYHLKSTGQRVMPEGFGENGTMSVIVSGRFNLIDFERSVFGIDPDDLTECELPDDDEPVGVLLSSAETLAQINERRAENGLPPMAALTDEEARKLH